MRKKFKRPKYPKSVRETDATITDYIISNKSPYRLSFSKKLISIILTISIIVGSLFNYPINKGFISNAETENVSLASLQTPGEAAPDTTPKIIGELNELRDAYNKHFRRTDGSVFVGVYPEGVHYLLNDKYEEIDNSLVETTLPDNKAYFVNKSNSFSVKFTKNAESRNLAKFSLGDTKISWYLENSNNKSATVKYNDTYTDSTLPPLESTFVLDMNDTSDVSNPISTVSEESLILGAQSLPSESNKTVTEKSAKLMQIENKKGFIKYEEILPLIDLEYITVGTMVKENITLKSKDAQNTISFVYDFGGLIPIKNVDNSINLYKQEDLKTPILSIAPPYMYDANYERSNNIEINIEKIGKEHKITLTADKTWLETPERVFPVIIDPTLETSMNEYQIREGYAAENTPTTNHNIEPFMKISSQGNAGGYDYIGYIRFENLPVLKSSDQIVNSRLILKPMHLLDSSSTYLLDNTFSPSPVINAYQVTSNWYTQNTSPILTYNTQPSASSIVLDYEKVDGSAADVDDRDYEWDVTKAAKSWYEDEDSNFGIKLKLNQSLPTSTWAAYFLSSDYNNYPTTFPSLTITYRNTSGLEGYYSYHEQGTGRSGTGYVNDYTGNLVFVHGDASTPGNIMPASVSHVYGNDKRKTSTDYSTNTITSPKYGNGWGLDAIQRIDLCSSDLIAAGFHYVLTDGDGTQHYFYRNDTDPVREYYDEDGLGLTLKAYISTEVVNSVWFKITDKAGNIMNFDGYIGNGGFMKERVDSNGKKICYNYVAGLSGLSNEHRKLSTIVDGTGKTILLNYDSNNVLTGITDAAGRITSYSYDGAGNLTTITYPDNTVTNVRKSYYYYTGPNSYLSRVVNFDGYEINYTYSSPTTPPYVEIDVMPRYILQT